jgi:hypothetical protein
VAGGCATRSQDVPAQSTNPADFAGADCDRLDAEALRVQRRAAEVAYSVDEQGGHNIIALGAGPDRVLAGAADDAPARRGGAGTRPPEGALRHPAGRRGRAPVPVHRRRPARTRGRGPAGGAGRARWSTRSVRTRAARHAEIVLRLQALRRDALEFAQVPGARSGMAARAAWTQDFAGNVTAAPPGFLQWPHLLKLDLALGQVVGGEMSLPDEPGVRAARAARWWPWGRRPWRRGASTSP